MSDKGRDGGDSQSEVDDPLIIFDELAMGGCAPDIDDFCSRYPEMPNLRGRIVRLQRLQRRLNVLARTDAAGGDGVPIRVGPYDLGDSLGQGGMGDVFSARHRDGGTTCALKILRSGSDLSLRRFNREISLAASLKHPRIARVYDYGLENGTAYLATELLSGVSLRVLMQACGKLDQRAMGRRETLSNREYQKLATLASNPLTPTRATNLALRVADALAYAHKRGVVHRDIKPSNIMVLDDDEIKLIDFGIAVSTGPADSTEPITLTGMFIGSPRYAAPEQLRADKRRIGPWSDTYALGATLFEMLTGRLPFPDNLHGERFSRSPPSPPAAPTDIDPDVPTELSRTVMRALSPKPRHRFKDGAAMSKALSRLLGN